MVKKLQKLSSEKKSASSLADSVKESAQQIWLAGLGAFAKAQEERGKVFEALVKEGLTIQRKTQAVAEEKISEATSKMAGMATGLTSKASGITSMATGQWDKLENIFEDRVAKALSKLGVPTSKEVAALVARIDELNKSVQKLSAKPAAGAKAAAAPKVAAQPAAKSTAKPAARKKAAVKAVAKPEVVEQVASEAVEAKPAVKRAARKAPVVVDTATPEAATA